MEEWEGCRVWDFFVREYIYKRDWMEWLVCSVFVSCLMWLGLDMMFRLRLSCVSDVVLVRVW